MGYSTPKKQLDLKEFLSQPAKKRPKRTFSSRPSPKPADPVDAKSTEPAKDQAAE